MAIYCYILCNVGEDQSTIPRDYAGSFRNFWNKMAKISISYKISQKYWTELEMANYSRQLGLLHVVSFIASVGVIPFGTRKLQFLGYRVV